MKIGLVALLVLGLLSGCGGGKAAERAEEVAQRTEALEARVKALESDLLAAQKSMIAQEQEMQKMLERIRTMENYFNRLQAGASIPR